MTPPQDKRRVVLRPFYAQTRFLLLALVGLIVFAYGWKVTEIKPGELVRGAPMVKPLVSELLRPDLIRHETQTEISESVFLLDGPGASFHTPSETKREDARLTLSPSSGVVGDVVTVSGRGWGIETTGSLLWINSIEQEFRLGSFTTSIEGTFVATIRVPETARGLEQTVRAAVSRETGEWFLSPTVKLVAEKMLETIFLALMATGFATVIAAPLSFLAAKNLMWNRAPGKAVYLAVRTTFNILRSIEPLILAILFAVWVGIGPFAGVLALSLHSIATLGKLFSEQIETIDPGPVEALVATGANPLQVAVYAVWPQVSAPFLALAFYRWDINVRMSTIIGFVGGGGIGFLLQQWINLLQYSQAGTALLAISATVIFLDVASAWVRQRMELKS